MFPVPGSGRVVRRRRRMKETMEDTGKILIYQNEKNETKIDVYFSGDTVWMTQKALAELYQVIVPTINEHIKNIYSEQKLDETATIRQSRIVQNEDPRTVGRKTNYYNFEMILAVEYRWILLMENISYVAV
jgi:hypothetical protein